ncbi:MAG TPA: sulfotransferase domain-containing protein [Allosphingosinicella sp.]|jgi:hypothetical protein
MRFGSSMRLKFTHFRLRLRAALGMGALPNALIIGAMKAGTTSLFEYLVQHPNVCGARQKELHYFNFYHRRGEKWYRANFRPRRRHTVLLEASPYYLVHPLAPLRARRLLPQAKLIVLLREPADRAYSHYQHSRDRADEPLSFEEALNAEAERVKGTERLLMRGEVDHVPDHANFSYVWKSLYASQIERWFEHFPRESFLFIRSEDMFANPRQVLSRVLDFLELPPFQFADLRPRNSRDYPPMEEWIRMELQKFFEEPNRRLQKLVGISWEAADAKAPADHPCDNSRVPLTSS